MSGLVRSKDRALARLACVEEAGWGDPREPVAAAACIDPANDIGNHVNVARVVLQHDATPGADTGKDQVRQGLPRFEVEVRGAGA